MEAKSPTAGGADRNRCRLKGKDGMECLRLEMECLRLETPLETLFKETHPLEPLFKEVQRMELLSMEIPLPVMRWVEMERRAWKLLWNRKLRKCSLECLECLETPSEKASMSRHLEGAHLRKLHSLPLGMEIWKLGLR